MIELADVEETLTLFAEGIHGSYLHIKSSAEFNSRRLDLDHSTSGQTRDALFLPEMLDAPDAAAYRVLALEQIGHRECGTYLFSFDEALRQIPELAERQPDSRYTVRTGDLTRLFRCFAHPAIAQELFSLLELARARAHILRVYPGIKRHMERFFAHRLLRAEESDAVPGDPLGLARLVLLGAQTDLLLLWPTLVHAIARARVAGATVYDSARLLLACYDEVAADYRLAPMPAYREPEEDIAEWLQRDQRVDEWEDKLEDLDGMMLAVEMMEAEDMEAERSDLIDGDVREDGMDLKSLKGERDNLSRRIDMERAAVRDALGHARPETRSYRYDEWNFQERRYLRHWCRLFEERLEEDNNEQGVAALESVIRTWRHHVQQQLEQIRPLGFQRVKRVADGDELDLNAIVEARQDLRAGVDPDERFYSRRERVHRDVCAAFLVDLSASTDDPVEPPPPPDPIDPDLIPNLRDPWAEDPWETSEESEEPVRKIIDLQREAMVVMAAALDSLGDSYGIYGFSGYQRDCVEVFVAKEFNEPFTRRTLRSIAAMKPKRSTRMGPAIRHGVAKLIASGQAMKVLIVISDGFPQDADYGPTRGDHEYGLQDTAKALTEAQQKGVETFCVTVDKSGHDYLSRMCPESRYMVIEELEDLPGALSKVYGALTGR